MHSILAAAPCAGITSPSNARDSVDEQAGDLATSLAEDAQRSRACLYQVTWRNTSIYLILHTHLLHALPIRSCGIATKRHEIPALRHHRRWLLDAAIIPVGATHLLLYLVSLPDPMGNIRGYDGRGIASQQEAHPAMYQHFMRNAHGRTLEAIAPEMHRIPSDFDISKKLGNRVQTSPIDRVQTSPIMGAERAP